MQLLHTITRSARNGTQQLLLPVKNTKPLLVRAIMSIATLVVWQVIQDLGLVAITRKNVQVLTRLQQNVQVLT